MLLHALKRDGPKVGFVKLCMGGGQDIGFDTGCHQLIEPDAATILRHMMERQMVQSIQPPQALDADHLRAKLSKAVHDHWRLFLIEGIVLIALGAAAVVVPLVASVAITIIVGWLFLIGGGVGLITTLTAKQAPGFWYSLLSAVLALAVGAVLLWSPLRGVLTLALVMAAYFFADGIASIMQAIEHRRDNTRSWGWLIVSGCVDLLLAALIITGWPGTAAWAIGLIVGIDLIFGGTALLMVALGARTPAP